jgi:TPR repeat protein
MPRITISYRRDDSGVITGRIFDRLAAHYGRDSVFRDIDNIPPGVDFRQHIAKVLDESDVLLAIVGPRWLGARGGLNRLDDDADPVRLEIETGLRKEMPVIPVLVLRAAMPRVAQLPESMKDFAYRHAVQVDAGQDFDVHAARLIRAMDRIIKLSSASRSAGADAVVEAAELSDESLDDDEEPLIELLPALPEDEVALRAPAGLGTGQEIGGQAQIAVPPGPLAVSQTVPPIAPPERRRGGLVLGLVMGAAVGAAAGAGVVTLFQPAAPPDVVTLENARQNAEARIMSLQSDLAAAQKRATVIQNSLDTAQQRLAEQDKWLHESQVNGDQAAKDLTAQKEAAAKAQAQVEQLTAQLKSLGGQQAGADQAVKELAAQKDAAAKAQAQLDQAAKDLAAQKDAASKAQAQADSLAAQVKSLQAQLAALPPTQTAVPQPPAAAAAAQGPVEATLTTDQKREVQRALVLLGNYQGEADGGFGPGTVAAIKQFQGFAGETDSGALSEDQRKELLEMAQRLSYLLDQPPQSPLGAAATSIKGGEARYTRGYAYESGKGIKADASEAAYWYALAAGDGEGRAFTNLGTLVARGFGTTKPAPRDAAILWWAGAARGEATAMFNLGALWEHGIGVAVNLDRAKAWYQRAAARGDPGAQAALKRLGG